MNLPYTKKVFPNGARLILVPMNGVKSIASAVMVGVGSRYETPEINGISHFLEHMVFKGTEKFPTTDDVNEIEKIGGLQNAYTDIDITNYHNKALAEDWQLSLEINKELALNPRLDQQYVDKERDVILEEMKRYEDEPAAKVEEAYHSLLYKGTKLGMRIIGEEKSLRSVAAAELSAFHKAWYQPQKMVVVLAGNFHGQESAIEEKVATWFGSLPQQKTEDIEIVTSTQTKPELVVTTKPDASQAHLTVGIRTFDRTSEDKYAWNLFNLIMGVSFTSRLFKEVREKRGLCYHVRSGSSAYADVGSWDIYAGVATDKVEEATKAILAELSKVREGGVTDEELAIAKKRLIAMFSFKGEDPEFFTEWYGRSELFGLPLLTLDDYISKIKSISKEDIHVLAKKYLRTETLNMSLVWNKPRDETLLNLLHI